MAAFALYGVSSAYHGARDTSVGSALSRAIMIITANLSAVLTVEWKDAPALAHRGLWAELVLLAAVTALIAFGIRWL